MRKLLQDTVAQPLAPRIMLSPLLRRFIVLVVDLRVFPLLALVSKEELGGMTGSPVASGYMGSSTNLYVCGDVGARRSHARQRRDTNAATSMMVPEMKDKSEWQLNGCDLCKAIR